MGKKQGIERNLSRTAMWTNICRAMANMEVNSRFNGPDVLAGIFISPAKKFLLSFEYIRKRIRKKLTPGAYEYLIARTQHYDNLFRHALDEDVPQIVMLGAGYDTRSIRFKDSIRHTRIFELDMPATQQHKIGLLQKANISIPRQLSFTPIDFSKDSLDDVLDKAGYDKTQKCLFVWEGVSMYLSEGAVQDTLGFIKRKSGPGSAVAFDYFYKSVVAGRSDDYGAREQYEAVLKIGEPFQFGIEEGKIESFLSQHGFETLSHYTPDEFENKYLSDDHETVIGKMYRCACNVHAAVMP